MLDLPEEEGIIGEQGKKEEENEEKKEDKPGDRAKAEPGATAERGYDCTYENINDEEIWKVKGEALWVS